jgi:hypothetical protein
VLWQLLAGDVGQRRLLEHAAQRGAHGHPDLAQLLGRAAVLEQVRAGAGDVRERAVNGADDIGQRDVGGPARQQVTAVDATPALDDACVAQVAEDVLEEAQGDALRGGDRLALYGVLAVGCGELDRRAKRVVGLGGDADSPIVART